MTIEGKREILDNYCGKHSCKDCALNKKIWKVMLDKNLGMSCLDIMNSPESDLDKALSLIGYTTPPKNPYWERITEISNRQREKGINTYGQGLELFTTPDAIKRIEYIQEELIDGLMYLEWLKEKLKGECENAAEKEN